MFQVLKASLLVCICLFFISCGSSSSNNTNNTKSYSFSGVVVDGYIKEATLCLDVNLNGVCDTNEPTTKSKNDGTFSFTNLNLQLEDFISIISSNGIDTATNKEFKEDLKNIVKIDKENFSNLVLSPITDVFSIAFLNETTKDSQTFEKIESEFRTKLNVNSLDFDPMKELNIFKKNQEIEQLKKLIYKIVSKKTQSTLSNKQKNIIKKSISEILAYGDNQDSDDILQKVENSFKILISENEKRFVKEQILHISEKFDLLTNDLIDVQKLDKLQNKLEEALEPAFKILETNTDENINLNKVVLPNLETLLNEEVEKNPLELIDSDKDLIPNYLDEDDDNDGVLDNDDYRPLDNSISSNPVYTKRVFSSSQTYVRQDEPTKNYNSKNFIQLRSLNGNFATLGLVYFDIPKIIDDKRVDEIIQTKLNLFSLNEKDEITIYNLNKDTFPSANLVTWNSFINNINLNSLSEENSYAKAVLSPNSSTSLSLTKQIYNGKNIFIIDENANDSREKLEKSSSKIYLDIKFRQIEEQKVLLNKVENTKATTIGEALEYKVKLSSMPSSKVRVYFSLANASATLSHKFFEFDNTNYNIAKTLKIIGIVSSNSTITNKLKVEPIISEDENFNGHNSKDIDFKVYKQIPKAQSSKPYTYIFQNNLSDAFFELENEPQGMSINEISAKITWQPDNFQVGNHEFMIIAKDKNQNILLEKEVYLEVEDKGSNPDGYYVLLKNQDGGDGTSANPFTSLNSALQVANSVNKPIYIRGGRYEINKRLSIDNINGTKTSNILISRLKGERVKLNLNTLYAFNIKNNSSFITIDGLEIDGNSFYDHSYVLQNLWWDTKGDSKVGGGIAFHIDGDYITIKNNIIHDLFQKGVNIYNGRYVNVLDNIVYNIGHSSLSGGHGIMRKWDKDFFTTLNPKDIYYEQNGYKYRYDFSKNLVFAVEQRIYSRVWAKAYANLTIDEGKAIVTDESNDYFDETNPRFRISNNLVVFNGIDHIKLKPYANMQVNNNTIHTDLSRVNPIPDGISDTGAMKNLRLYNNLVTTKKGSHAIDIKNTVDANEQSFVNENYASGGGNTTNVLGIENKGELDGSSLFNDVANNDFTSIISNTGVENSVLNKMFTTLNDYAIELKPSSWQHNHINSTDLIISSIPSKWFDTRKFYVGDSSVEIGHKALYIKILDGNNNWLYDVLGEIDIKNNQTSTNWSLLDSKLTSDYNFDYTDIRLCEDCKGAYVFQLIPAQEWFENYGITNINNPKTITLSNSKTINLEYLDINIQEHKKIYQYSSEGKIKLQGESSL